MPAVEWTDDMSVGVKILDEHHKRLVVLINTLNEVLSTEAPDVIGGVLAEVSRYTRYHFAEEERLLELAAYEDLEGHREAHRIIVDHVRKFEDDYRTAPSRVVAAELYLFLSDWLVHHIKVEDGQYRAALSGRKPDNH